MITGGRPLRFLMGATALWVGGRVAHHWRADATLPVLVTATIAPAADAMSIAIGPRPSRRAITSTSGMARPDRSTARSFAVAAMPDFDFALTDLPTGNAQPLPQEAFTTQLAPLPPSPATPQSPRFAGSGWLIVRGGKATPFAPQLGGSQAGMRLTYAIDDARRLALSGRMSGSLGARQSEAAVGIDWRPTALPVHLVVEQRIGIAGIRGAPAMGLIGGVGPTAIAGDLQVDAYAQAGAIARRGGYVDGALRIAHPVAAIGPVRVQLGLGAWGGAQRGAARLDAGPAATVVVPLATRPVRLSLDWRQRIAGRAAPASGPALSIGTDF